MMLKSCKIYVISTKLLNKSTQIYNTWKYLYSSVSQVRQPIYSEHFLWTKLQRLSASWKSVTSTPVVSNSGSCAITGTWPQTNNALISLRQMRHLISGSYLYYEFCVGVPEAKLLVPMYSLNAKCIFMGWNCDWIKKQTSPFHQSNIGL